MFPRRNNVHAETIAAPVPMGSQVSIKRNINTSQPSPGKNSKDTPLWQRMVMSALSGMGAATFCHPLDVIRVNMQVDSEGGKVRQYNGFIDAAKKLYAKNGLKNGLYPGLSAAYLRQWLYGSFRMGVYSYSLNQYKEKNNGKSPGFGTKMLYGAMSGGIGSFVGTPSELALVRMGADNKRPPAERRGYTSVINCIYRVAKEESIFGLWRGATVTVIRAMGIGVTTLGVTSQSKEVLLKTGYFPDDPTGIPLIAVSATIASFFGNLVTNPFDVVKSRLQNMKGQAYSGMIDCAKKSVAKEGVLVLWSGFTPAFIKLAPYVVISLTLLEQITFIMTGKAGL